MQDTAYDPFGVPYSELRGGNGEISFTGQNKDTAWLQYDFMDRQYDPNQGRWLSPDPVGLGAVDPASPQSWNRYAYVQNNPLALVDPFGDDGCYDPSGNDIGVGQMNCYSAGGSWLGGRQYISNGEVYQLQAQTSVATTGNIDPNSCDGGVCQSNIVYTQVVTLVPVDLGSFTQLYPGQNESAIVAEPGNPGVNIDEQAANANAVALAQAINKTGVQNLSNPCTIGGFYAASALLGAALAPATQEAVGNATVSAANYYNWSLPSWARPLMQKFAGRALSAVASAGLYAASAIKSECNAAAK